MNLDVNSGEIVALIGANGAGKTTMLRTISGLLRAADGEVLFEGLPIHRESAETIARLGIAHVPEGRRVFSGLTVFENLQVATTAWHRRGSRMDDDLAAVFELFPRLRARSKQLAWSLSGGEQQMLAMGRGLMARPKLLLLDEPSLGLAPTLVEEMFEKIQAINHRGTAILLVEQNAHLALEISHRAYVLETGMVVLEGDSRELSENPRVQTAYLGI